jgi:hypothetical protein
MFDHQWPQPGGDRPLAASNHKKRKVERQRDEEDVPCPFDREDIFIKRELYISGLPMKGRIDGVEFGCGMGVACDQWLNRFGAAASGK